MSNVLATNKTLSSITVSAWAVYYINSSNAELVTVYDSSNNPYDCFKYLLNNISYYYVLDGVQNAWTNDLSVIGYSLTPSVVLPTVTYVGQLIYPNGGLTSDETGTLRDSNNNPIDYNTGSSYAVYWYASSSLSYGDVSYVSLVNESGLLKVKNISNAYLSIYFVSTYECSSNAATVVPVYNSSNVAYNAFKFTASGTDYYYVLDGTQTDWTDDLSSIGYRLDMQFYFYFSMNNDNPVDVTFDYPSGSNYWGLRIQNQSDKDILDSLGLFAATQYPASAPYGYLKAHTAQTSFSYELKAIFLPDDTQAPFSLSDFYCYAYNSIECVVCSGSYSTPVRSCMISIKPIS